jgi:hypothetical protein
MHLDYSEFALKKKDIKNVFKLLMDKVEDLKTSLNTGRTRLDDESKRIFDEI